MNRKIQKLLSLLLSAAMLCGLLFTTAFAAEPEAEAIDEPSEAIVEVVEEEIAEEAEEPAELPEAPAEDAEISIEDAEVPADAEPATVDDEEADIPASGEITTADQLKAMTDGDYYLGADITIDAMTWTAVANFNGSLDGKNKTITWTGTSDSNRKSVGSNFAIIGTNNGTVKNLTVAGALYVSSNNVDYISTVVGYNNGIVDNVTNEAVLDTSSEAYNVGGIAGYNTGYILNCANSGAVSGYARVGGIVGDNEGIVNSCSNSAQVYMDYNGKGGVGGIAGFNGNKNGTTAAHIWNCYNTGFIVSGNPDVPSSQGSWVGGITGFNNAKSDCVNCYNKGNVSGYRYLDHIAGDNEGGVVNCYGWGEAEGPEGFDGAAKLTTRQMTGLDPIDEGGTKYILAALNAGNVDGEGQPVTFWAQSASVSDGYPTLLGAATKDSGNPTANTFTIVVYSAPTKLTYTEGESFDTTGMEIRAVYTDGTYDPVTEYSLSPSGALSTSDTKETVSGTFKGVSFSFAFDIKVNPATVTTIYLDVVDGNDSNDGKTPDTAVKTYAKAVELAGDGGIVIINHTVTFEVSGTESYFDNVTFKRADGFTGALFKMSSGTVRLAGSSMVLDGGGSGTLVEVVGGAMVLRGGVTLKNCETAVDVRPVAALTVNKATISASEYSVKLAGSTSTFTLEDYGGTSISGTVYLGNGAYINVGAAIPNALDVESVATDIGTVIAEGTGGYELTDTDVEKITVNDGVYIELEDNTIIIA